MGIGMGMRTRMGMGMGMEEAAKQGAYMNVLVRTTVVLKHKSRISDRCPFFRERMRREEKRKMTHDNTFLA